MASFRVEAIWLKMSDQGKGSGEWKKHDGRCYQNRKARRAAGRKLKQERAQLEKEKQELEEEKDVVNKQLSVANLALTAYNAQVNTAKNAEKKAKEEAAEWASHASNLQLAAEKAKQESQRTHEHYQGTSRELAFRKAEVEHESKSKEKWKEELREQKKAGHAV